MAALTAAEKAEFKRLTAKILKKAKPKKTGTAKPAASKPKSAK
jgi:hypothetical protein